MPKLFQKKVEDFVCSHCGIKVVGNGYTNHCPKCLWSKHVDINPGDRQAQCRGLMEPIAVVMLGQEHFIIQRCQICGFKRKNKVCPDDDFSQVIKLSSYN